MYLYLYHRENNEKGSCRRKEDRAAFHEKLIRQALRDCMNRNRCILPDEILSAAPIAREKKGKPYFPDLPAVHFSVSHSADWWGCLMAAEPVGFDLEVCRERVGYEKIARRFFAEEECDLILTGGREAFFDVWVRKEAYVKYLGSGLAEGLSNFLVAENGRLSAQVIRGRTPCYLSTCEIGTGVKAAYCCASGDPVKATILFK